jgi:hypothetical protein
MSIEVRPAAVFADVKALVLLLMRKDLRPGATATP